MKILSIPKKSLAQNFLIDQNIINKIIQIGKIQKNKTVLEIGPGYGGLTKKIASMNPKKIIAIEKDRKLSILLNDKLKNYKNIRIINDDILNLMSTDEIDSLFNLDKILVNIDKTFERLGL